MVLNSNMRNNIYSIILVCFLVVSCREQQTTREKKVITLPFYTSADFMPRWLENNEAASAHRIPAFCFVDQLGDTITEQTVANKIYVAGFFFTSCPGICKTLTNHLSLVQKAYKDDPKVLLLSHSVTPESDSIPRLLQYANSFDVQAAKWHLLTGNRTAIYRIAREAYFADEDMGETKTINDFLHTENLLLIDTQRRIRGVYKGTSARDVQDLIADIKILEQEQ
jgi:protein SCO1/2